MSTSFSFSYTSFESAAEVALQDQELLQAATEAISLAYAPYSGFAVGAALRLADNSIVKGSNQENASYPAGICAERVALATASTLKPGVSVTAVAIAYRNHKQPDRNSLILSPCGICRQSLLEINNRQEEDIRLIMSSPEGKGIIVERLVDLLPFAFSGSHLH